MNPENQNPAEQKTTATGEPGTVDEKVAEELAEQVAGKNGNGNGSGSNGSGSGANGHTNNGSNARGHFDMWDDLANETEQDKQRAAGGGAAGGDDPFSSYDPKNDVTEEEITNESMTLKEANATVSLYMAMLDFGTSLVCCGIRDDFSLPAQLKYRIHPWRKKAIQIPWVRLVMLPGKKRRPGWALTGAILAGTIPTIGLAIIDNWHEYKRRSDPNYNKSTKDHHQGAGANYRAYRDPRSDEHPGFKKSDVEYADYEEIKEQPGNHDDHHDSEQQKKKPGRHAKTCPRHLDPENGECNCK